MKIEMKMSKQRAYAIQAVELLDSPDIDDMTSNLSSLIANNEHHGVVGEMGPERLIQRIVTFAGKSQIEKQKAVAELGRLVGALPEYSKTFAEPINALLDVMPPDIEILQSARQKTFFATALFHTDAEWVVDYCLTQALKEDQAERARKRLLKRALRSVGNLDELVHLLAVSAQGGAGAKKRRTPEHRLSKSIEAVSKLATESEINIGSFGPASVIELLQAYLRVSPGEKEVTFQVFEDILGILVRIVQRQMFHLLMSETFEAIPVMKAACRRNSWRNFADVSTNLAVVRSMLLDAVTMLAGQEKTDREFVRLLDVCFESTIQLQNQLSQRMEGKGSIGPEVRDWWVKLGKVRTKSKSDQRVDITVDQQLALLKLKVEDMNDAIGKLRSDVAPILHISDPILAPVITHATSQFESVARTVRQLCRIRKLESMGLAGARVEFNPKVHEFYSNALMGERKVKVVRDGVLKDYGGSKRPVLKALVESLKH